MRNLLKYSNRTYKPPNYSNNSNSCCSEYSYSPNPMPFPSRPISTGWLICSPSLPKISICYLQSSRSRFRMELCSASLHQSNSLSYCAEAEAVGCQFIAIRRIPLPNPLSLPHISNNQSSCTIPTPAANPQAFASASTSVLSPTAPSSYLSK